MHTSAAGTTHELYHEHGTFFFVYVVTKLFFTALSCVYMDINKPFCHHLFFAYTLLISLNAHQYQDLLDQSLRGVYRNRCMRVFIYMRVCGTIIIIFLQECIIYTKYFSCCLYFPCLCFPLKHPILSRFPNK